jgi:dihydroorotase-like cyclic amidohydrolase
LEEKSGDSPPSGVPGMEYNLLLLFDAFARKELSLQTIITACSENPARYFGIPDTGKIERDFCADCVLLDPLASTTIDNGDVQTKASFTPYHGRNVQGSVEGTIVNGAIGFWQGEFFPTQPRDLFPQ